jgi:membrane protease YdiL (CAAX protease family)
MNKEQAVIPGEISQAIRDGKGRARAAIEIALVTLCVLIAEWVIIPLFGRNKKIGMIPIAAVLLFSFLSHRSRRESAREIGFSGDNFLPAIRLLVIWMVPASAVLFAIGWWMGSVHFNHPLSWKGLALSQFWLYLWGVMQQYALQAVVNRRAQEIWGRGSLSILFTAFLFAALHLPNLWLMVATLAGGILWAAVYQRAPNLFALAISHSIMTTILSSTTSPSVMHGMRVGYNYF